MSRCWWQKDSSGYFIFSNDVMSHLPNAYLDTLHSPMLHRTLEQRLRLILHTRYSHVPFHSTEFVSVNFVYSGHLVIDFPTRRLILQEGQLIFMNSDIVHALSFEGENDIIMGFQIEKGFLDEKLLYGLKGNGPVVDFLIHSMMGRADEFSYLISGFENDDKMKILFEDIFCEYLDPGNVSDMIVENYVRIFFAFLIRSSSHILKTNTRADLRAILAYIEEHYMDCTLDELARKFHFSPKSLGNLDFLVREIAENCGYTNMTFFFRRFRERYNISPSEYRQGKR